MSRIISIRLSTEDEIELEKLKVKMNMVSTTDVIRNLIYQFNNPDNLYTFDNKEIRNISKDSHLTLELLKQFYGEMTSFKEYNPAARKCEKLKQFLNDYYNPEDKFLK